MANEVGLRRAQQDERPAAHSVTLGHGDGDAAEATAEVHRFDMDVELPVGVGAAGEHRLHRLDLLGGIGAGRGHNGLSQ